MWSKTFFNSPGIWLMSGSIVSSPCGRIPSFGAEPAGRAATSAFSCFLHPVVPQTATRKNKPSILLKFIANSPRSGVQGMERSKLDDEDHMYCCEDPHGTKPMRVFAFGYLAACPLFGGLVVVCA